MGEIYKKHNAEGFESPNNSKKCNFLGNLEPKLQILDSLIND